MTTARFITYRGKTRTLTEWCDLLGMKKETLRSRIARFGMEAAMRLPMPKPQRAPKPRRHPDVLEAERRARELYQLERADGAELLVVGQACGISKERARQTELVALAKLRIAGELVELIGADLTVELLTAMRPLKLSEWERTRDRFKAIAQWAARKAA